MKAKLIFESLWVTFFILLFLLFQSSVLSFYFVPSQSMYPNIVKGDRVFVFKSSYGLFLPFVDKRVLAWSQPERGDVVVFYQPNEDSTFVKRVIGLPGDKISFDEGQVRVNGSLLAYEKLANSAYDNSYGSVFVEKKNNSSSGYSIVSRGSNGRTFFNAKTYVVPQNSYFVLGDNRDNSYDSRDFGFVSADCIYGKVFRLFFSTQPKEGFWPHFQLERSFLKVN